MTADARLRRMADHFRSSRPDRAAEAWAELEDHAKAARYYTLAGDEYRDNADYAKAKASYLRAASQHTLAGEDQPAQAMRQAARDCEAQIREVEQTGVMREQTDAIRSAGREQASAFIQGARISASQTRESFAALAETLREGFVATSRALVGGLTALAEAQREAAVSSAEIVFRGLERLSASQTEGFSQLSNAVREGDLLQALSTYAGLRGIARREAGAAEALHKAIADAVGGLSPAQKESAALNTLRLFDTIARMLPASDPAAPGPVPESTVRTIVESEMDRIRSGLGSSGRVTHAESSNCLLGSGPSGVVLNIVKEDGMYQRCNLAYAALKRRWHGIDALSTKYLEQGGCPLPRSLGIVQRHLWFRTCPLADGREHEVE